MSVPPTSYSRQYDYQSFQEGQPTTPLPAQQIHADLDLIDQALDTTQARLAEIQRADGALQNHIVGADALSAAVRALMVAEWTPRGPWATATAYAVKDTVTFDGSTYICAAAHTSGTFATDLAADRWMLVASPGQALEDTDLTLDVFSGTGAQTVFILSNPAPSDRSIFVFVNGVHQRPGYDYSVSTTTLTFNVAPGVGTNNVIVLGQNAAIAAYVQAAKDWATKTASPVESGFYGAKYYADAAATSQTAAASSASSASSSASAAAASATAAASSAAAAAAIASAGLYAEVLDKSADYSILSTDDGFLFQVSTGSGNVVITLPLNTATDITNGFRVAVAKMTGDTNKVLVRRSGSNTINGGAADYELLNQYQTATFVLDDAAGDWLAIGGGTTGAQVRRDAFTGDGVTTAFVLSSAPASELTTFIFIDGVHQNDAALTINGSTVTFAVAPPNLSKIEVRYFEPTQINVPADGSVTTAKIADSNVTTAKIADSNVTTAKVADKAITVAKLAGIRGWISGLGLTKNTTDPNNDTDFAAGLAAADTTPFQLINATSGMTKRLDAAWSAGNNQGGLDTGAKANNTWYHCFLIGKAADPSAYEFLYSTSALSPTMPATWDLKRRIGSVRTDGSGNIIPYTQDGDLFRWDSHKFDLNTTSVSNTAALFTVTLPSGVRVEGRFIAFLSHNTTMSALFSPPDAADEAPDTTITLSIICLSNGVAAVPVYCLTNTSSQIRRRESTTGTVSGALRVATIGWRDFRGAL